MVWGSVGWIVLLSFVWWAICERICLVRVLVCLVVRLRVFLIWVDVILLV